MFGINWARVTIPTLIVSFFIDPDPVIIENTMPSQHLHGEVVDTSFPLPKGGCIIDQPPCPVIGVILGPFPSSLLQSFLFMQLKLIEYHLWILEVRSD